MTKRTSAARRAAFFAAVRETGNQTLAAERAKVSRSWVQLHRADPQFLAELEAAVAEGRARVREAAGTAPPAGWGSLDGEELVVRGTNGRRTQIARARVRQWTPRVEARFLAVLAATCNVRAACAEVGLSPASAYAHYQRWLGFAKRWDQAIDQGYMRIEAGLIENCCNLFSSPEFPPELPMPEMSTWDAIRLLQLYQHRVHQIGKKPGRWRRPRSLEEVRDSILRKLECLESAERAAAEDGAGLARARRDWAERREGGDRGGICPAMPDSQKCQAQNAGPGPFSRP